MKPEKAVEIIEDFLNNFLDELDNEIILRMQGNYKRGKDLIGEHDKKEIEGILYTKKEIEGILNTKNRIESILSDDVISDDYYGEV